MTFSRRITTETGWREAVYSDCERYRYRLSVHWQADAPKLAIVMLNPSKATEAANDPTIERCERRARALGYGGMEIVNLFGLRETSPAALKAARKPEGPDNREVLLTAVNSADAILAAWGVHGAFLDQNATVESLLRATKKPLLALGTTKDGHPRHPLYVAYSVLPTAF